MALVSAAIVAGFLVPGIAPIFADSGKPMPAGLRAIVAVEDTWVAVAAGIAGTAALATFAVRAALARPEMRLAFDRFKLRLPGAGALLAKIEMARFARTAGTLLRAGVPLLQSLAAARDVLANAVYAQGVAGAIEAVRNGESLARALSAVPEVPAVLVQMVRIGEESRKTDHMLLRVAAMFETQSQRQIDQATALLTPALTIAIATLVGGLILTVMNAILSINDLVGQ